MHLEIVKVGNIWQITDNGKKAPWTSSFKTYAAAKRVLDQTEECIHANNVFFYD